MSALGVISGRGGVLSGSRMSALGEEKKIFTTAGAQYWMDLFHHPGKPDARLMFGDWVSSANKAFPGSVKVMVTEADDRTDPPWGWVKFQTNISLPFPWQTLGVPTRIKPGQKIDSSDDTTTADEVTAQIDKENEEQVGEWVGYVKWALVIAGVAVGAQVLGNLAKVSEVVKGSDT